MKRFAFLMAVLWSATASAADCTFVAEHCVDGPSTKLVAGIAVTRDCWRKTRTYRCLSATTQDTCAPLAARGCTPLETRCLDPFSATACATEALTYRCPVPAAPTREVLNCGDRRFCLEGRCFDTAHTPDPDFAKAIAAMEAQREAGKSFDPANQRVFHGTDDRCRHKLADAIDCCGRADADGGFLSNFARLADSANPTSPSSPSRYVYDALFGDPPEVVDLIHRLSPTGIAAELLSCRPEEKTLAFKRERRLCHAVGSYCSRRVPLTSACLETTETRCCFRSTLARILQEQGRAQLGRAWGSAESPDCTGLTVDELQGLDFSRMDLSEFTREIQSTLPDNAAIRARVEQRVRATTTPQ